MAELTPKASRKLSALLQTAQDAEAAAATLLPRRQKLEEAVALARRRAQAQPEEASLQREAESMADELAALEAEQIKRRQRHEYAMINYNRAREWALALPHRAQVVDVAAPKPEGDLAFVRDLIAKLKGAVAQLKSLAPEASETAAIVEQYVKRTGAAYTPRITLTAAGLTVDFAYVDVMSPLGPFGVACWLDPAAVTKRLTADVSARFGTGGLSA
jgi:hypothetical protein